jgi:hypothetical protein
VNNSDIHSIVRRYRVGPVLGALLNTLETRTLPVCLETRIVPCRYSCATSPEMRESASASPPSDRDAIDVTSHRAGLAHREGSASRV